MQPQQFIRQYYDHFNARRLVEAAAMLAADVQLEHRPMGWRQEGSAGYLVFTHRWLAAFPDGQLTIERIDRVGEDWYEVSLIGEGTHEGDFDMGPLGTFAATHKRMHVRFRHLMELRNGRIASSSLSFDTQDFVTQFNRA